MATTYTFKAKARYWKQHTCPVCGAVYRYRLIRDINGQGASEAAARTAAHNQMQSVVQNETEPHACPTCGTQPLAVYAARRRGAFVLAAWVGVLACVTCLIIGLAAGASMVPTMPWVAAAIAFVALVPAFRSLANPNADRAVNRARAMQQVEQGWMVLDQPGDEARADAPADLIAAPVVPVFILLAAALACTAPELMRMAGNWPLVNPSYSPDPVVAGPGDTVSLQVGPSFTTLTGKWKSDGESIKVTNGPELGITDSDLKVTASHADWGGTITVKKNSSADGTATPTASVTLPDMPQLAGKTIQFDIEMEVVYPKQSMSSFTDYSKDVKAHYSITMSPPGSGSLYRSLWLAGLIGAAVLFMFVAGFTASSWSKRRAHQSEVWPLGENE